MASKSHHQPMSLYLANFICFAVTFMVVYFGERNTKYKPAQTPDEFDQRMIVAVMALLIFIALQSVLL